MSDSTSGNFRNTITDGIQEISALLPLLGTEQCEEHISSGLTRGYFYVAATPLSIFSSLGLAKAAFKTLVASIYIPSWNSHGARILANARFWGVGDNLPLILLDQEKRLEKEEAAVEEKSKEKSELPLAWGARLECCKPQKHGHNFPSPQYLAGSRLHSLLKDLRVHEDSSITLMLQFGDKHLQQEGPLIPRHGMVIPHHIPLQQGYETLFTKWTLMTSDTRSQRLQYEDRQHVMEAVEGKLEDGAWHNGLLFLNFSSKWREIEKKVLELYCNIDDKIIECTTWLRARLTSLGEKEHVVNMVLKVYWRDMEKGLLKEVHCWDCKLWDCHQQMTKELDSDCLKEQAVCDWSTNTWNQLNDQVCCMEGRTKKLEYELNELNEYQFWGSWGRLIESMTSEHPS
ncbi:hypothetical protein D9758_012402 [Tetrapyrgos nigripes]|uniref:Uncharacterized protein n=1 Tax=Tetrapyrgos nigripes TaxID=182062 RepID=A0A8H5D6I6_9AGAR|nr:hypothetical protein D9758_012402 [Tetrapyrgos nigripes]